MLHILVVKGEEHPTVYNTLFRIYLYNRRGDELNHTITFLLDLYK